MTKRVLVIEDNVNNMDLMEFILQSHSYDVIKAFSGRAGVEAAERETPDFILLDIQLPDIMGTEVLRQIRAAPSGKSVPIIAVTSFAMSGDEERLLAAGCNGYIEKPINPDIIMDQIKRIVGNNT